MFEKTRQDQSVSGEGTALQVNGNLTVNHGMSLAQMAEVMREVRDITQSFTADAMVQVEKRIADFQETVLKQFADDTKTNAQAFKDPDFQLMIGDAQKAYARSGDDAVKETLADIIARRSLAENASRLALTLNDAAARAPKLTKAEFAALSLCYLCRYTKSIGINNTRAFADYINKNIIPFVDEVSNSRSSYWHIESQSCGRLATGEVDLRSVWTNNYGGVLGKGIALEQAQASVPEAMKGLIGATLQKSLRDSNLLQPGAISRSVYVEHYKEAGIPENDLTNVWNTFVGTIPTGDDLAAMLEPEIPHIGKLFEKWKTSPIKSLELNSAGIAIGHANAVRVVEFGAPLNIWID